MSKRFAAQGFTKYEYRAELMFALVNGVIKAKTKLRDNCITPYLRACLKSHSSLYKSRLPIVRIPRSSMHKYGLKNITVQSYEDSPDKRTDDVETRDLLESLITSPLDNAVLNGLMAAKTRREIAKEQNVSITKVKETISFIRNRFNELSLHSQSTKESPRRKVCASR